MTKLPPPVSLEPNPKRLALVDDLDRDCQESVIEFLKCDLDKDLLTCLAQLKKSIDTTNASNEKLAVLISLREAVESEISHQADLYGVEPGYTRSNAPEWI